MKKETGLLITGLILMLAVYATGCGSGAGGPATGGGAPVAAVPVLIDHVYRYDVSGVGMTFSMDVFTNFENLAGHPQHELTLVGPTFTYTIPDGNIVSYTPTNGTDTLASFSLTGGIGTLSITRYRDGIPIDSQTNTIVGTTSNFALLN